MNHSRAHNYWSCLVHLIFTVVSGWCWRHTGTLEKRLDDILGDFPGEESSQSSSPVFLVANGLFVYLSLHGALGVLRFGHPQLCMNGGFRKIYEVSFVLLRILPCALITWQVYGFYWTFVSGGVLRHPEEVLFQYNLTHAVLGIVVLGILNELWKSFDFIKLLILSVDVGLLMWLGVIDESYWTVFLGVQILLCNFGLDFLSRSFEISFLEVFMIGMCFFDVFAYRSLAELIDVVHEGRSLGGF